MTDLTTEDEDRPPTCEFCGNPGYEWGGLHYDGWLCETCATRRENGCSLDDLAYDPTRPGVYFFGRQERYDD